MLRIDRILVVVPELDGPAGAFARLLGAEPVRDDRAEAFAARRRVLALGESEVELLAPDGTGAARRFLDAGGGLFAAGIGCDDPGALEVRLRATGVEPAREGERLLLSPEALGVPGLRLVVSPLASRKPAGWVDALYEVTLLCDDATAATGRFAALFGLDAGAFVPIRSEQYGYEGTLTLFDPGRLDRLEIIRPFDLAKTMGRFFTRRGPAFYMAYAESGSPERVRERALAHAPDDWTGPRSAPGPDNQFLHPRALGGVMLGVSRRTFAWTWSGSPDRVRPAGPALTPG